MRSSARRCLPMPRQSSVSSILPAVTRRPRFTALKGTDVGRYVGIDISPSALELAGRELVELADRVTLIESDFAMALASWQDPIDVAWIGMSLHHLQPEGKLAVMRDVRRALAPGGMLLIWEPTLLLGE